MATSGLVPLVVKARHAQNVGAIGKHAEMLHAVRCYLLVLDLEVER